MSADQVSRPKAVALNVRERTRGWLNAVNLHWAGVVLLAIVNVYLLVQMGLAWRTANSDNAEALATQRIQLRTAEIAAKPLEGLDVKLAASSTEADRFYLERLPVSYSEIAMELGVLRARSGVRLSRVNYAQPVPGKASATATGIAAPPAVGADQFGGRLTEVQMDASLTGDYRSLITFINGVERDKVFFLINGVTLTGQQTGQVSLRLRMTTYLRGLVPAEAAEKVNLAEESPLDVAGRALDGAAAGQAAKVPAGGAR